MPAATKKKKKPKTTKTLFRMKEGAKTADGKGRLFTGYCGGFEIGVVVAKTKTDGKKKLLRIARCALK